MSGDDKDDGVTTEDILQMFFATIRAGLDAKYIKAFNQAIEAAKLGKDWFGVTITLGVKGYILTLSTVAVGVFDFSIRHRFATKKSYRYPYSVAGREALVNTVIDLIGSQAFGLYYIPITWADALVTKHLVGLATSAVDRKIENISEDMDEAFGSKDFFQKHGDPDFHLACENLENFGDLNALLTFLSPSKLKAAANDFISIFYSGEIDVPKGKLSERSPVLVISNHEPSPEKIKHINYWAKMVAIYNHSHAQLLTKGVISPDDKILSKIQQETENEALSQAIVENTDVKKDADTQSIQVYEEEEVAYTGRSILDRIFEGLSFNMRKLPTGLAKPTLQAFNLYRVVLLCNLIHKMSEFYIGTSGLRRNVNNGEYINPQKLEVSYRYFSDEIKKLGLDEEFIVFDFIPSEAQIKKAAGFLSWKKIIHVAYKDVHAMLGLSWHEMQKSTGITLDDSLKRMSLSGAPFDNDRVAPGDVLLEEFLSDLYNNFVRFQNGKIGKGSLFEFKYQATRSKTVVKDIVGLVNTGYHNLVHGNYEAAITCFTQALEEDQLKICGAMRTQVIYYLALSLTRAKRTKEGKQYFKVLVKEEVDGRKKAPNFAQAVIDHMLKDAKGLLVSAQNEAEGTWYSSGKPQNALDEHLIPALNLLLEAYIIAKYTGEDDYFIKKTNEQVLWDDLFKLSDAMSQSAINLKLPKTAKAIEAAFNKFWESLKRIGAVQIDLEKILLYAKFLSDILNRNLDDTPPSPPPGKKKGKSAHVKFSSAPTPSVVSSVTVKSTKPGSKKGCSSSKPYNKKMAGVLYRDNVIFKVFDHHVRGKRLSYFYKGREDKRARIIDSLFGAGHRSMELAGRDAGILVHRRGSNSYELYVNEEGRTVSVCGAVDHSKGIIPDENAITRNIQLALSQILYWQQTEKVAIRTHTIAFSYHVTNVHWCLGELQLYFNENKTLARVSIRTYNTLSLGGYEASEEVRREIESEINSIFGSSIVLVSISNEEQKSKQTDGSSCGVFTSEYGKDVIDGVNTRRQQTVPSGTLPWRQQHVDDINDERFTELAETVEEDAPRVSTPKLPSNMQDLIHELFEGIERVTNEEDRKLIHDLLLTLSSVGFQRRSVTHHYNPLRDLLLQHRNIFGNICSAIIERGGEKYTDAGQDILNQLIDEYGRANQCCEEDDDDLLDDRVLVALSEDIKEFLQLIHDEYQELHEQMQQLNRFYEKARDPRHHKMYDQFKHDQSSSSGVDTHYADIEGFGFIKLPHGVLFYSLAIRKAIQRLQQKHLDSGFDKAVLDFLQFASYQERALRTIVWDLTKHNCACAGKHVGKNAQRGTIVSRKKALSGAVQNIETNILHCEKSIGDRARILLESFKKSSQKESAGKHNNFFKKDFNNQSFGVSIKSYSYVFKKTEGGHQVHATWSSNPLVSAAREDCLRNYRDNRENGAEEDNPPSNHPFPGNGTYKWVDLNDPSWGIGKMRYEASPEDEKWMEEKDRNYKMRLQGAKRDAMKKGSFGLSQQAYPTVFKLPSEGYQAHAAWSKDPGVIRARADCLRNYRGNRENGTEEDNPTRPFPATGRYKWDKTVKERWGFGRMRYEESHEDRKWMEEKDKNYLLRTNKSAESKNIPQKKNSPRKKSYPKPKTKTHLRNKRKSSRDTEYRLVKAAQDGDLKTIREILDRNPEIVNTAKDRYRWSVLHQAASSGQVGAIQLLLRYGANIEIQHPGGGSGNTGWTPLHTAAHQGRRGAITALLEAGANPNAKTTGGGMKFRNKTPAEVSIAAGRPNAEFIRSEIQRIKSKNTSMRSKPVPKQQKKNATSNKNTHTAKKSSSAGSSAKPKFNNQKTTGSIKSRASFWENFLNQNKKGDNDDNSPSNGSNSGSTGLGKGGGN